MVSPASITIEWIIKEGNRRRIVQSHEIALDDVNQCIMAQSDVQLWCCIVDSQTQHTISQTLVYGYPHSSSPAPPHTSQPPQTPRHIIGHLQFNENLSSRFLAFLTAGGERDANASVVARTANIQDETFPFGVYN
jgi:hypothetical protein